MMSSKMKNSHYNPKYRNRRAAFTLLELIVAMSAFIILIGGVFALVGGSVELMEEIEDSRNRDVIRIRFIEAIRHNLEEMPPNAELEFDYVDKSGNYNTYLSLVNAPHAFDFGFGDSDQLERVIIASEIQTDGFIRCGIYYLTAEDFVQAKENNFLKMTEYPYVELVPRMRQVSWQFYSSDQKEWEQTIEANSTSSLTELLVQFEGDSTPTRSIFWHLAAQ